MLTKSPNVTKYIKLPSTRFHIFLTFEYVVIALLDLDPDLHIAHGIAIEHVILGATFRNVRLVTPLVGVQAVLVQVVEGVVLYLVVTTAEAEPNAVLAVLDLVVVDLGTERLQEGDSRIGIVVDVVVCTKK